MQRTHVLPGTPVIGIIGSAGAFGRWFSRFFSEQMRLQVLGYDPQDPQSTCPEFLAHNADVLLFSVPIRHMSECVRQFASYAQKRQPRQLWIEICSLKHPISKYLRCLSVDVLSLHPMCAPPSHSTLFGQGMIVCTVPESGWTPWVNHLLTQLEARIVRTDYKTHDRVMAIVQSLTHAIHLVQASVLADVLPGLGENIDLQAVLSHRSKIFALDIALVGRILSSNSAIYEDIQFYNPFSLEIMQSMKDSIEHLYRCVQARDASARSHFQTHFFERTRHVLGNAVVANANASFVQIASLHADIDALSSVSILLFQHSLELVLPALCSIFMQFELRMCGLHTYKDTKGRQCLCVRLDKQIPVAMRASFEEAVECLGCAVGESEPYANCSGG